MMSRVGEVIAEIKNNPPPLPVEEIAEATQFLEWLVANNFTFLGVREYALTGDERGYEVVPDSGLGILRSPDVHVLRRGNELVSITPEIMEFLKEPKQLIITKANVNSRVHRRVHMDYIGVKRFDRRRQPCRRIPHRRPVHLDGLHALDPLDPVSAAQGRQPDAPLRLRSGQPFRQGVRRRAGALLARRAVPDRRGHAVTSSCSPSCISTSVRACACWRGAIASTGSCRSWCSCRASATTPRRARPIGTYLAGVYKGRVSAFFPSFTEGPLVRVHFIIARLGGETPNPDRATLEQPGRGAGAHLDRRARRGAHDGARADQGAAADPPLSRRIPDRLSRGLCAGDHGRRYPAGRKPLADPPARRRLLQPPRGRTAPARASRSGAARSRSRSPSACPCWRTWASRWSTSAPTGSSRTRPAPQRCGSTTCCWSAPTARHSTSRR